MSEGRPNSRVGVRELRQNLSIYLRRVRQGEALDVTERGQLIAHLTPVRPADQPLIERLTADGKVTLASEPLARLGPPPPAGPGRPLSTVLHEMRDEERA